MISLQTLREILIAHNLFKEVIYQGDWHYDLPTETTKIRIEHMTYDSREVQEGSLFFCKGLAFKPAFLDQALSQGARVYVAEQDYPVNDDSVGVIVADIKKAMAVISMAFYHYPQNKLKIIAYTGTKGKTTAAYFCHYILAKATNDKTALLSTMETILDGVTPQKSLLTTPESLDLYRMMAEAVGHGMSHLVMEVSSQAYKMERVYGLTFDVGIFLNISPDHIGDIEHPNFEDYFYCKRRMLTQSRQLILNADSDYFNILLESSRAATSDVLTYSQHEGKGDYVFNSLANNHFDVTSDRDILKVNGHYQINLAGDFNQGNALSAILATRLVGAEVPAIQNGLATAKVPGRMEQFVAPDGRHIYIDYAHNFLSLQTLLSFVKTAHPTSRLHVVIGSTGGKAQSRRQDFSKVLSELADVAILTTDDPGNEDPLDIIAQIKENLAERVETETILDREAAIRRAFAMTSENDVIVLAGKGPDLYQIVSSGRIPYKGDIQITEELIGSGK